jgi:FdhD protein
VAAATPGAEAGAEGARPVAIERWTDGAPRSASDRVAHEEPLEIQLDGSPLAVVMRTPGDDLELALGFLPTERVIVSPSDLASLRHESVVPRPETAENVVRATLRPGRAVDVERLRRSFYASASCGVCGKASLEEILATAPPLDDPSSFDPALLYGLPDRLREAQCAFAATGGLHAAALFDADGELLVVREDVGRHNAVDKVVGFAAAAGWLPLSARGLLVSGRISFEIAQKALAARIPLVAAVSAPSSLAVHLAAAGRIGLVGFLRGRSFNAYGCVERLRREAP